MRRTNRKRLLILLAVLLIVGFGGWIIFLLIKPKTVIQTELSERARKFIASRENDSENWRSVNLTPMEERIGETVIVEDCFSFVFPFNATTSREQDACNWLYNFQDPIGRVVIRLRDLNVASFEDVPDVRLRRDRISEYVESRHLYSGHEYMVFEKMQNGYEISAFALMNGQLVTISLTSQINESLASPFSELLETFMVERKN